MKTYEVSDKIKYPYIIGPTTLTIVCGLTLIAMLILLQSHPMIAISLFVLIHFPALFIGIQNRKAHKSHREHMLSKHGYTPIDPQDLDKSVVHACTQMIMKSMTPPVFSAVYNYPHRSRRVIFTEFNHTEEIPTSAIALQTPTHWPNAKIRHQQPLEKNPHYRDAHVYTLVDDLLIECKEPSLIMPQLRKMNDWFLDKHRSKLRADIKVLSFNNWSITFRNNWIVFGYIGQTDHQTNEQIVQRLIAFSDELSTHSATHTQSNDLS